METAERKYTEAWWAEQQTLRQSILLKRFGVTNRKMDQAKYRIKFYVFSIFPWNSHIHICNCPHSYFTGNFCNQRHLRTFLCDQLCMSNIAYTNYPANPGPRVGFCTHTKRLWVDRMVLMSSIQSLILVNSLIFLARSFKIGRRYLTVIYIRVENPKSCVLCLEIV